MYVPVSRPLIEEDDVQAVATAVRETNISGLGGPELKAFEEQFAAYCESKYAVTCSNGTTALHLAMLALDITKGDEVIVSSFTNMATFFAVLYVGATPIPVDSEPRTHNIDVTQIEGKITPRTKAIIVVHIYGHPVDMDPVMEIAKKHNLRVVEDCAEAHGATYKGKKVGSFGDINTFSFYANKVLSTGEGGAITTNDESIALRVKSLKSLAFGKENKFMHQEVGYNYRMTNMQCALGLSQLKKIESIIEGKRTLAQRYTEAFADVAEFELPVVEPYATHVYWMYNIVLRGKLEGKRDAFMKALKEKGVETRPDFMPFSSQELFIKQGLVKGDECPVAHHVGQQGMYLPSGPAITAEEITYTIEKVKEVVAEFTA